MTIQNLYKIKIGLSVTIENVMVTDNPKINEMNNKLGIGIIEGFLVFNL